MAMRWYDDGGASSPKQTLEFGAGEDLVRFFQPAAPTDVNGRTYRFILASIADDAPLVDVAVSATDVETGELSLVIPAAKTFKLTSDQYYWELRRDDSGQNSIVARGYAVVSGNPLANGEAPDPTSYQPAWADIINKPAAIAALASLTPAANKIPCFASPTTANLADATTLGLNLLAVSDGASARSLIGAGTSSFDGAYSSLSGVPSTFAPSAHSHAAADITNFDSQVRTSRLDQMAAATNAISVTTPKPDDTTAGTGTGGVSPLQLTFADGGDSTALTGGAIGGQGANWNVALGVGGIPTLTTGTRNGGPGGSGTWQAGDGGSPNGGGTINQGGAGGGWTFLGGAGGSPTGGSGYNTGGNAGNITFSAASGGNSISPGGSVSINGGAGGVITFGNSNATIGRGGTATGGSGDSVTGGAGSTYNWRGKAGGAASGSGSTNTGGAGSVFSFLAGNGGAASGVGSVNTGGQGSRISMVLGAGGAASGSTSTNAGGAGGSFSITLGAGANATGGASNTGGAGGFMSVKLGAGGTGNTANGANGYFQIQNSGGTSLLNVDNGNNLTIGGATAHKVGFYGITPVAQQTLATGAGKSVDDVIAVLQTIGLCKQS